MKLKKALAILLASAMVMGSAVTTFAAQVTDRYLASITVHNLSENYVTTLDLYNLIYLDETTVNGVTTQSWKVADWVTEGLITVDSTTGAYKISDKDALLNLVNNLPDAQTNGYHVVDSKDTEEHTFSDLPVGAYVVRAKDDSGVYSLMVANTYNEDEKYMEAKAADVYAKLENYNIDKKTDDDFVSRGETVEFTVTTQFPPKTKELDDGTIQNLTKFIVTDQPEGLDIQNVTSIIIGDEPVNVNEDWLNETTDPNTGETTKYTIDLSSLIDTYESGVTVEIKYTAIVLDEDGYNNSVGVDADTVDYLPDTTEGWSGKIKVTKVAEDGKTTLKGAEFQVLDKEDNQPISFVEVEPSGSGIYRKALANEVGTTTLKVNESGVLEVLGLDEGTYVFKETKAPDGYKVTNLDKEVPITEADHNVAIGYGSDDAINIVNTKLSSLPSTGGIGTTIFTIGGCVIMITAAGLYFASRRRQENK